MKLSAKKQESLYAAIADPIMDERVLIKLDGELEIEGMDDRLYRLQNVIWHGVRKALKLEGVA